MKVSKQDSPETGKRVLLVDDEPSLIHFVSEVLGSAGYAVATATSAREALEQLEKSVFDLAIVDIIMPEMDGLELIRHIRRSRPNIQVLAISGGGRLTPDAYLSPATGFGAIATLEKPFDIEKLLSAIKAIETPA